MDNCVRRFAREHPLPEPIDGWVQSTVRRLGATPTARMGNTMVAMWLLCFPICVVPPEYVACHVLLAAVAHLLVLVHFMLVMFDDTELDQFNILYCTQTKTLTPFWWYIRRGVAKQSRLPVLRRSMVLFSSC